MGTYVPNIAEPPFEFGDKAYPGGTGGWETEALVQAKYDATMSVAEEMRTLFLSYLSDLNGVIKEFDAGSIVVSALVSPTLDSTTITAPTIPSDGALFATLLARLIADLESGATGLDPAVEQAIWDRADARLTVQEAKDQTEIESYFSSRGFDLPTGAMAGRLQEHLNERARNRTDLNDKILIQTSELAQKNSQFIIGVARELKKDLLNNEMEVFAARSTAQTEKNKAIVAKYEVDVKQLDVEIGAAIEELRANLGGYSAIASLRERISSGMANVVMQAMASAYGSVNMSASLSHQTGRSESESFSHGETRSASYGKSENLSESHDFEPQAV